MLWTTLTRGGIDSRRAELLVLSSCKLPLPSPYIKRLKGSKNAFCRVVATNGVYKLLLPIRAQSSILPAYVHLTGKGELSPLVHNEAPVRSNIRFALDTAKHQKLVIRNITRLKVVRHFIFG